MKKKTSEFGKITGVDLLNALYHGLAAVSVPFVGFLGMGKMPTHSELFILLSVFCGAVFADVFKRGATNSAGEVFKKENN
jgi:hypothetical protein